ncbi:Gfo/Idh/MocA family oxidoreductase [Bacillus tianshenii]|uniref:Gfo/Idh/MocA family protein n=1 Tax=Sutcliffiella tianshenii TaxID=1463404 RepID=UPI001CD22F0A|nr:Gfo/Idh/MocA family oxidoreductase [Bacillus tianshenii]MCA1319663.1 Gfo/Idh/MocA family oxidoreductase [Bacillus tianshenii]
MIQFAIVGAGAIAPVYAGAINMHKDARLTAVCDKNPQTGEEFRKQHSIPTFYTDYKEMLQDPSIDVICICTPSGLHADMAIQAIEAGKHVIIEKPIALTMEDADRVIAAADKYKVKAAVAFQKRYNRPILKMREKLENGSFGKMMHATTSVRWYRDQSYYDQDPWRGTALMDGGALMNQSIHNIDLLRWMMGPVRRVSGFTATRRHTMEMEDTGVAVLEFESGALGVIEGSTAIYPTDLEASLSLFGTSGTAIVGGKYLDEIKSWHFLHEDKASSEYTGQEGHYPIIDDMVQAFRDDRDPAISLQDGRNALEIILAIYESTKTGNSVHIK